MSLLDFLIPNKRRTEQKANPYTGLQLQPGIRYSIVNGRLVTPTDNKSTYITEGYNKNEIIYAVINLILDKVILPDWRLYKIVDENKLKQYERIMSHKNITAKDYKRAMQLKYESLEPLSTFNIQAGKLKDLLKYPNDCDTFQDHNRSLFLFKLLTGDYYEWWETLSLGANSGMPNSLWSLPSQHMTIKVTEDFPAKPAEYQLMVWNKIFSRESILHEKYVNPNWNINGEQLYGFSPLKPYLKNLVRNNSSKDAAAAQLQNGGLSDIIYMDDSRFSPEQGLQAANALKIKLAEEYSGPANYGKHAISGVKTGVAQLGNTIADLGIKDLEEWDAIMACNIYGVPPELLGLTAKTYNNMKEAEKALTSRSAIPLLNSRKNSLNRQIQTNTALKGQNVYCDYDIDCFPELQVDMNQTMTAVSQLTMRTPNEEREAINWEMRPEPEADEVWVKTSGGMQPLSDYQASVVDQALMNQSILDGTANSQSNGAAASANGKARVSNGKVLLS